ncbi:unnamed protein product [Arabidopsis arenosa]|uniref:En/Spm-like transposon protein n=1 Tax=Arabidopsis arenosa TaxID=38785 RepID=A0A8S2B1Z0_ARAAE|nr:unnamed protein product [Arabidopsis arenosa]
MSWNDYSRFLSTQPNPAPPVRRGSSSQGTSPVVQNVGARTAASPQTSHSQNDGADGSTPPPTNPNSPLQPSNSATQSATTRLNNLTIEELLESPGRQSLTRLDPNRPPGTLWFDIDGSVAATVRSIFERDFKEPHANWTQTPEPVINRWFETFAQMYNWDRSINQRVRDEFEDKLKDRMSDQVSRWKAKWKNIGDEACPKWIDPTVWAGLVRFWRDPRSERKSINSRNARYHDPDGTGIHKHRSGQTSYKARARKHSEKTGDSTPDLLAVLEQTHRKPDGSFVDGKSEELFKEVSSRIEEQESQLFSGDNMESSASGGLSVHAKNKIYAEVAPRKKGRLYGAGSLQQEASSANTGPSSEDPVVLSQKLALAQACIATQAERMHSYDAYFEYLAEKDPEFAAKFKQGNQTATTAAIGTEGTETGTGATGASTETGTGATGAAIGSSSPSAAF